jgi:hypothetical protein
MVCGVALLLNAAHPRLPRLNAITLSPSVQKFAWGVLPTALCQPTMPRMPAFRSVQVHCPLVQLVSVTMPFASEGGESSAVVHVNPERTCGWP